MKSPSSRAHIVLPAEIVSSTEVSTYLFDTSVLSLETYDVARPIAERAGLLRRTWAARGRTLALADLLIASTALELGLGLVTDNAKDFPMKELRLHASPDAG